MDRKEFWHLIEDTRVNSDGNAQEQVRELEKRLTTLGPSEIISFEAHMCELMDEAYRADLWNVAYIIEGGCSDDGFEYLRYWLILQGKRTFYEVLSRPEALADFDQSVASFSDQELPNVARRAYSNATGQASMPFDSPTGSGVLQGALLSPEEMKRLYPVLWKRFIENN